MSLAQQIEQIIAKELGSVFDREKKEIAEHIIKWLTNYCEIIDEKLKKSHLHKFAIFQNLAETVMDQYLLFVILQRTMTHLNKFDFLFFFETLNSERLVNLRCSVS